MTNSIRTVFWISVMFVAGSIQAQAEAQPQMRPAALPEVKTYEQLRDAISQVRSASRARLEKLAEQEKVREAWEIGRLIDAYVLGHRERADYAGQMIPRLASDLGMSESELYRMLAFYRAYPILASTQELSWGHYRELLAVHDDAARQRLAEKAVREKWSERETRKAVAAVKLRDKGISVSKGKEENLFMVRPGKVGTYRMIRAKAGPYTGRLAIDLGFANYLSLGYFSRSGGPKISGDSRSGAGEKPKSESLRPVSGRSQEDEIKDGRFSDGDIVTFDGKTLKKLPAATDADLFTYEAYVTDVLDGDTITAVIDLGFGFATTQTLRLRGIDAPERITGEGKEAQKFLADALAGPAGEGPSRILIRAVKSDKYDRYLADVFVAGRYLNQELVANDLAVVVEK